MVCDVWRNSISRKKSFSKTALTASLADASIGYRHFPALGISSAQRRKATTGEQRVAMFSRYREQIETTDLSKLYE